MGANGLFIREEKEVAKLYQTGKYTQEELANKYHVAPITIRRALAEQGVVKLVGYKTRKENRMLQLLENYGVTKSSQLEEILDDAFA